jgi:signal transduction histidine kinase
MSPGSWLTVNVARALLSEGARVRIDFEDQGSGISEDLLEKIFEPGFTTHTGSSGLGLAVCKKVIEQHGGTIRVHSAPRLGTTVSLCLPLTGEMA